MAHKTSHPFTCPDETCEETLQAEIHISGKYLPATRFEPEERPTIEAVLPDHCSACGVDLLTLCPNLEARVIESYNAGESIAAREEKERLDAMRALMAPDRRLPRRRLA